MVDFGSLLDGLLVLSQPLVFTYMIAGFFIGVIFAAIPGLTGTLAIALLLPITFGLDVHASLVMCAAIFMAAQYGGSITAITVNIPGAPSSVMAGFEGNILMRRGDGARALRHAAIGSAIGGVIGALLLILFAPLVSKAALYIQTPGKFSLILFALIVVIISNRAAITKGVIATVLGLMLSTIGVDVINPVTRQTFGSGFMLQGFDLMAIIIGTFAISEIFVQIMARHDPAQPVGGVAPKFSIRDFVPRLADLREIGAKAYAKSSVIGYLIGVLPGAGGSAAAFVSYAEAKRASKTPEKFGDGSVEGIAAAESANNAMCGGSLVPMLTFGIPGDPISAMILGVLIINGLQPGPRLFTQQFDLIAPMMMALLVCALLIPFTLALLGSAYLRIVNINKSLLFSAIAVISLVGTYVSTYSTTQMYLALGIGVLAFVMAIYKYPTVSFLLGFILGPDFEVYLRRSLSISDGDPMIFVTRLDSLFFLVLTAIFFYFMVLRKSSKTVASRVVPENP